MVRTNPDGRTDARTDARNKLKYICNNYVSLNRKRLDKNHMNTRVIKLWRVDETSLTTSVSTMRFLAEILLFL